MARKQEQIQRIKSMADVAVCGELNSDVLGKQSRLADVRRGKKEQPLPYLTLQSSIQRSWSFPDYFTFTATGCL